MASLAIPRKRKIPAIPAVEISAIPGGKTQPSRNGKKKPSPAIPATGTNFLAIPALSSNLVIQSKVELNDYFLDELSGKNQPSFVVHR